jgi:hypothetical protein
LLAAVHGDHFVAGAEGGDLGGEGTDAGAIAVDQQQRLSRAVGLVIQRDAVMDECSARLSIGAVGAGGLAASDAGGASGGFGAQAEARASTAAKDALSRRIFMDDPNYPAELRTIGSDQH